MQYEGKTDLVTENVVNIKYLCTEYLRAVYLCFSALPLSNILNEQVTSVPMLFSHPFRASHGYKVLATSFS